MKPMSLAAAFRRISGLTGLSRILGFLRDIAFAAFLGAGPAADAFLVALKLPNMFRRLTAEGALANAFVPSFAEVRDADGSGPAMRLAGEVQTTLLLVLTGLVVIGEIMMPSVIALLAPGFVETPDRLDTAVRLARVTFPYLPMISLVAFWAALANADDRFSAAALMPVIFNICLIAGAVLIPVYGSASAEQLVAGAPMGERAMPLALGLLVAGVLQLVFMGAVLIRAGIMPAWLSLIHISEPTRPY